VLSGLLAMVKEVAALHQSGIVHRDLSPNNIHIEYDGQAA
jgi:serine/threonine protein kinase